ncbi:hypothetical protein AMS68_000190 [Peltaster fructicola]|uniref:Uncharacterized protein n=1 Tax=Peltaster fructicola TaxID=286661 RepID=A0A6H0XIX0_9PEZI|nr:hypothetical protein AMS68_000190 [Peltaster fructicola]
MAPRIPALAQSEPKSRFVQRLGLDDPDKEHIYALLIAEAGQAWTRLMMDRSALLPNLRDDPRVQPPYSVSQVTETAMHRELLAMAANASPQTRPYYELAHDSDPIPQENWVCRWALWHVFRNRDQRKKSRRRSPATDSSATSPWTQDTPPSLASPESSSGAGK